MNLRRATVSLLIVCLTGTLVACGGRVANPVQVYRVSDDDMNCTDLKTEMAYIEHQVDKLIPELKKTGKNVALGAAGVFFIFPWFFMDVSGAEKQEIRAYNERYLELEKRYKSKCSPASAQSSQSTDENQGDNVPDLKTRLMLLEELKTSGLISEDEYQEKRQAMLSEI